MVLSPKPTALDVIIDLLGLNADHMERTGIAPDGPLMQRIRDRLIENMMDAMGFRCATDLLDYYWGEDWVAEHPEEWASYQGKGI